jgi:uncharacterized repeat protein (TIGR01451 family)
MNMVRNNKGIEKGTMTINQETQHERSRTMKSIITKSAALLFLGLAVLGTARNAQAETLAGTTITNTATLNYTVGTFNQTPKTSSVDVVVDRKINVTVTHQDAQLVNVSPNQTWAMLTFAVQNTGNSPMKFALTAPALAAGQQLPNTGTPSTTKTTSPTSGAVYSDAGHTTLITDTGILAKDSAPMTVYVFVTIPLTAGTAVVDTDKFGYRLEAKAVNADGSNFGTYASPNNLDSGAQYGASAALNNVFADGHLTYGAQSDDADYDGKASDRSGFLVNAAQLSIVKSSFVYSDPVNGVKDVPAGNSPKAIPGAIVEYRVMVTNAAGAGATAQGVTISDSMDANLTLLTSATTPAAGIGTGCAQVSTNNGSTWTTDIADATCAGGVITNLSLGNIAAGSTGATAVVLRYRAQIK